MRRFSRNVMVAFFLALVLWPKGQVAAAVHPVNIGLNANWEQWLARSANVGWVRIDVAWWDVNPSPGVWDFGATDARVSESLSNGQQILAILHAVPAWAGGGPNGNIPPLTTTDWTEFVRQVAQHYAGQIAAYEIWNEPNDSGAGSGIGWDRSAWEPPFYVDFFQSAAQEIHTYSPGSLVVGPVFTSRLDSSNKQNRAAAILTQLHAAFFPNWNDYCCCTPNVNVLDVLSFHNNGKDTTSSLNTALELKNGSLAYQASYAPCLSGYPIWVTEYGWKANQVTEAGQREKICNITKMYTGSSNPSQTGFDQLNINRSFIFLQKDPGTSQAIFRSDYSPTPTVTQYLQPLVYPATQGTGTFPNCSGALAPMTIPVASPEELRAALAELAVGDPAAALPPTYKLLRAERDGDAVTAEFEGPGGDSIQLRVAPAIPPATSGRLSEGGAEWDRNSLRMEVVRPRPELGARGLVSKVAAALDSGFGSRCLIQQISADAGAVRRLGLRAPEAPKGFASAGTALAAMQPTPGCGSRAGDVPEFDFVWTFRNEEKETLRAGIYRYGESFEGEAANPGSLHWSNGNGTRYWVAVESPNAEALESSMYEVARSMFPGLDLKPR